MHDGTWKLITHSTSRLIEIFIISSDYIDSSIFTASSTSSSSSSLLVFDGFSSIYQSVDASNENTH